MQIVALSGKANTGKDYIYATVLQQLGFHRVALADHFKNWIVGKGEASYADVHLHKPPVVRTLLQQEGTERGRNVYGEDVWCRTLGAWMQHWERTWGMAKFAITDVRFPNEVAYVQSLGGKVYRIHAPERAYASTLSHEARAHISETALDDFTGFDGIIANDPVHSHSVGAQVRQLLNFDGLLTAAVSTPAGSFHLGV